LTSVLIAEYPVICALLFADKKVIAKTCVDKSVDICLSQVLLGTVELRLSDLSLLEMGLEDSLWMLWLHLIKVASQLLVVLTKLFLSDDLVELIILRLIWVSLSSEHESHLLLGDGVWALLHYVLYEVHVVHFLGNSKSVRVLALANVNIIGSCITLDHLLSISSVLGAAAEISAHSIVVSVVAEATELAKTLSLHHEINSLWLFIMINELWDNNINELHQIISRLIFLNPKVIVLANLSSKTSEVLVSPSMKVGKGSLKAIVEHIT
jgi:hypothetical protein